jgi:hypothetical protein
VKAIPLCLLLLVAHHSHFVSRESATTDDSDYVSKSLRDVLAKEEHKPLTGLTRLQKSKSLRLPTKEGKRY